MAPIGLASTNIAILPSIFTAKSTFSPFFVPTSATNSGITSSRLKTSKPNICRNGKITEVLVASSVKAWRSATLERLEICATRSKKSVKFWLPL